MGPGPGPGKNGLHYFVCDIHTATYVEDLYFSILYSPGPVQALSEWAIKPYSRLTCFCTVFLSI